MQQNPTPENRQIVSIVLAAGRGARMQSTAIHKVCHTVEGRPAIARAVETYHRCGIASHYVVVGAMGEQVMEAVSSAPGNHFFCYQPDPRGTGSAARVAASLLSAMRYEDDVMVVAGDKVIEPAFLQRLLAAFRSSGDDLHFVVGDADDFPSSGRVVYNGAGAPLGVIEVFDIARMQLLLALRRMTADRVVPAEEAEQLAISYLGAEGKASAALGALWESIKIGRPVTARALEISFADQAQQFRLDGSDITAEALAGARHANLSVYLFRAPALYAALEHIFADNAQQEEYLTDAVCALATHGYRVRSVPVDYPQQVMAFNTPAELRRIEEHLVTQRRETTAHARRPVRPIAEWLHAFEPGEGEMVRCLVDVYGAGSPGVEHRRRLLVSMLREYRRRFGDGAVAIARAPGRINVMGRHVDHQGGHGNMIAIDRDVLMVAGAREDRLVVARNIDARQFSDRRFDIDAILRGYRPGEWVQFVDGPQVQATIAENRGDWSHYMQAAVARFQAEHHDRPLHGMNIVVSGNVPVAAGLSSSSALVVATAEALSALNHLHVQPQRFVELCGEGEWYVGTRGGAGDHAAMKFGRQGHVVQVGFYPMAVADTVPLPSEYLFLVCNSHAKARKTAGARDVFNHRVACYHLGRELLKRAHPEFADRIGHLRDVNQRTLDVDYPALLALLTSLPAEMRRSDIRAALPPEIADRYLSSHSEEMDVYPIRPVVIFGLAECERSRTCPGLLRAGNAAEFGRYMNLSHDGDRVVRWDRHGNSWPYAPDYSDASLEALAARAASGDPGAALACQPGAYSCSIPQIDRMVDTALAVEGVVGAQIAGAGLGGCMMAMVHANAAEDLRRALTRHFYEPHGLEPDMIDCTPVAGSGALAL